MFKNDGDVITVNYTEPSAVMKYQTRLFSVIGWLKPQKSLRKRIKKSADIKEENDEVICFNTYVASIIHYFTKKVILTPIQPNSFQFYMYNKQPTIPFPSLSNPSYISDLLSVLLLVLNKL